VSANDLTLYDQHARSWWDADHAFARSLREVNRLRLELVRARFSGRLRGMTVVDVGCGGGLFAEPLAGDGARVLGLDRSAASLTEAVRHARHARPPAPSYLRADARRLPLADGCAALVLCADLLEHVEGWRQVLAEAARLLAPGGEIFVTTVNAGWRARLLVVTLGEGLGLVPRGTHDAARFISPQQLIDAGAALGLECSGRAGLVPNLLRTALSLRLSMRVGTSEVGEYAMWLRRPPA
jgi:2-polyprenyl-6-hydroxyphenyl methylase/3-demethylubiquinone-9 3-methyltransferase